MKDYNLLGFSYQGKFYFGLGTSAMICQRTMKAVVHIFTEQGFLADIYLDGFYGAEYPSLAFCDSVICSFNSAWTLHLKRIHRH